MNATIGLVNGPKASKPKAGGMDRRVKAMARQMGIDISSMGAQAEQMWSMLDDLATSDPEGYKKFIAQQAKEAEEGGYHPSQQGGDGAAVAPKRRSFRPRPALVIKTSLAAPCRIEGKLKNAGYKLFINMCCHEAIEGPRNAAGHEVDIRADDAVNASGLQIPLLVGAPRLMDGAVALDVVTNPAVTQTCAAAPMFLTQTMALVQRWVAQEVTVRMANQWKKLNAVYKGGLGPKGNEVIPFPLEDAEEQAKPQDQRTPNPNPKPAPVDMDDPTSLLAGMSAAREESAPAAPAAAGGGGGGGGGGVARRVKDLSQLS
uniref:PIH1 N-terminal domain-containing protein n=2 Tax=Phaeomonas parva TaxID=124430 RepID=A0A7S1XPG6_9STRA|mmetsp:Transcript_26895/g.84343  ORF Transcript_26895/g.84343 Transcript_26895/m.84343 type:complete len:316 (+) Transcript_26895:738-1685(+)